jgi:hypothetical protein
MASINKLAIQVSHGWEFSRFRPDALSWGPPEKNAAE